MHARRVEHPREGSDYWLCLRHNEDAHFLKYPPLPVQNCPGYEPK
jgi:hypothetical protein